MIRARIAFVDGRTQTGVTLHIAAAPETPVTDLIQALKAFRPADGPIYLGDKALTTWPTVGSIGLHDGQALTIGGPGSPLYDRDPHQGVDVLVAGGPDAGRVVNLRPGQHVIGRDPGCSVPLADPEVSRLHARVLVSPDGRAEFADAGSVNRSLVNGHAIEGAVVLQGEEYIRLGESALSIVPPEPADTALVTARDGSIIYNRRFRSASERPPDLVEFPSEFEEDPPPATSWIYIVLPMVAGLAMAAVLKNPMYLMFAVLGPVTGIGGMVAGRRLHKKRQAAKRAKHEARLSDARAVHAGALTVELRERRRAQPDPASLVRVARGPRRQLWERRTTDQDFLVLRVGLADQPSMIDTTGATAPPTMVLPDVPVSVPLVEAGSVGVAGPRRQATGIARTLLFQVATLHSPSDVRIMVLSPEAEWAWIRWLPHVRSDVDDGTLLIASDPTSTRARLDELEQLIAARRGPASGRTGPPQVHPRIVILFDRPSRLERSRVNKVLGEGPGVGVHAIIIEETEPELPEEFAGATIVPFDNRLRVRVRNHPTVDEVREEVIALDHAELAARCLAPLRPEGTAGNDLPGAVRFLSLIGLPDPSSSAIRKAWKGRDQRCRATIGESAGGRFEIELDDRAPHGLVAGTSGAGKSEFLKTFLASLALNNHPDDLQFLLIDFKGGGDFRTLARLPHTVALVTNTDDGDQSAVKRALELLEAEVERRQRLVNEHGARDLPTYKTTRDRNPRLPVLGRLLVVADEFAELASRQPELLDKMVSVARVGRAMGVHLVLATQRPSGAVTPQIQANVPLRICFRVLEGQGDEVIGTRDPEKISRHHAGRGYVRFGDEPPVEMQCARVANARPDVEAVVAPLQIDVESWTSIGHPKTGSARPPEVPDTDTDLWVLVEAMIQAAAEEGWTENAVPWPNPLPDSIRFAPERATAVDAVGRSGAVLGMRDDPKAQRHVPYAFVFGTGNLAIAGAPGTGRTTTLRTLVASAAYTLSPAHLHVHALDLAGGGLRALRPIPHVGTIADDMALGARLLERLEDAVGDRRNDFSTHGWSNLSEQWAEVQPIARLPYLLLVVDGWDALAQMPGSGRNPAPSETIAQLLSEGASVGLLAAIAGDRSVIGSPIGRLMTHRLALRFNDPNDFAHFDISGRSVPSTQPPGRALLPEGAGMASEVQIAHVGRDPSGPVQVGALRAIGDHLSSTAIPRRFLPWRLAPLPSRVSLTDVTSDRSDIPEATKTPVIIGVGGDEARPIWIDLDALRPGFTVAGPSGSGRSTALLSIAECVLAAGQDVLVVTLGTSPLTKLAGRTGVRDVIDGTGSLTAARDTALRGPCVVLVDDADRIDRRDENMVDLVDRAVGAGVRLVVAVGTDAWREVSGGWTSAQRVSRSGLLLAPRTNYDASAIGVSETLKPEQQFSRPVGRALWISAGTTRVVQVPLTIS